jgi:hypothetical protein
LVWKKKHFYDRKEWEGREKWGKMGSFNPHRLEWDQVVCLKALNFMPFTFETMFYPSVCVFLASFTPPEKRGFTPPFLYVTQTPDWVPLLLYQSMGRTDIGFNILSFGLNKNRQVAHVINLRNNNNNNKNHIYYNTL